MKQVFRFDDKGYYVEPVILEFPDENGNFEIPSDCTEVELPQPNWKPKWTGEGWEETITPDELESIEAEQEIIGDNELIALVEEQSLQIEELQERVRALEGERDD